MLRELSSSMKGDKGASNSLVQPVPNGISKTQSLPRGVGGEGDEVTFEVKVDQGLSGLRFCDNYVGKYLGVSHFPYVHM